jgi:Concanavalin A-like lectin/glucanases superfamily
MVLVDCGLQAQRVPLLIIHRKPDVAGRRCGRLRRPAARYSRRPRRRRDSARLRGVHDGSASGDYTLRRPPVDSEVGRQAHWLFCPDCQMLHFGGRNTCMQVGLGGPPPGPVTVTMRRRGWHHVAVVRASNLFNLHVDGRNIGELPSSSSGPAPSASLRLGRVVASKTAGVDQFYGLLDDLAIFKRAIQRSPG